MGGRSSVGFDEGMMDLDREEGWIGLVDDEADGVGPETGVDEG